MPLFYFHLRKEDGLCRDDLGVEFPSLEAAYLDTFRTAQALWAEMLRKRQNSVGHAFEIADARGRVVLELPFTEVLEACGGGQPARVCPRPAEEVKRHTRRTLALADALREDRSVTGSRDPVAGIAGSARQLALRGSCTREVDA